jgi:uncharacterized membrane protein YfhO
MKQKPVKTSLQKKSLADRQPVRKQPVANKTSITTFLNNYTGWIAAGLVFMLQIIIFHDFILGNSYYLFKDIGSDTLNSVYPQLVLLAKYIRLEGFPLWSFAQGMGQNIMPTFGDPFNLIVLLGGADHAAYTVIIMELVKLSLIAWLFYLFLGYWNLSAIARITGTLLYTFSGFMVVGGSWMVFTTEAFTFTLLLLAFEKIFNANSWYLFPFSIALIAIIQPFDLFILALFLIVYFLFRFFSLPDYTWKRFFILSAKLISLSLLGLLISSFFMISNIMLLLDSPRVSGSSSYFNKLMSFPLFGSEGFIHNITAVFRFFGNDLLGNGSNFRGWDNYLEAPMTYIGLLPLLLFPQVFLSLSRREKYSYGLFFLVFFLPFIFPFFRYAFWAFSGDYYRIFSLFISLVLLLFTLRILSDLNRLKKVNLPLLAVTLILLLGLLYFPYSNIDQVLNAKLRSFTVLLLFIYAILITFINYTKNREIGFMLLLLFVFIEIGYVNFKTVSDRDSIKKAEWRQKSGYNDYSNEAVAFLKERDNGFFRVNKDYSSGPAIHNSYNDAKIQDFYGTLSYFSFNQKYYIRFLEESGIIKRGEETQTRWASGLRGSPLLQRFGSVKYTFTKQPPRGLMQFGFDSIGKAGDVNILQNRLCLPLGFTYNRCIPLSEFQKLPRQQKEFMLFKAFVAEEPVLPGFMNFKSLTARDSSVAYSWNELTSDVNVLRKDTLQIEVFSNNHIKGNINPAEPKLLFFSIPFDKGWHATIDGKSSELVLCNLGFIGLLVTSGQHKVELNFIPAYFYLSLWLSLGGLLLYLFIVLFVNYTGKRSRIVYSSES